MSACGYSRLLKGPRTCYTALVGVPCSVHPIHNRTARHSWKPLISRSTHHQYRAGSLKLIVPSGVPRSIMSNNDSSTDQASKAASVPELPNGMEAESRLLEAFAQVPNISKVHTKVSKDGSIWVTAFMSQRNLPANSQRKYAVHVSLPAGASSAAGAVGQCSLPVELPSDAQLFAPSPSGVQQLVFKSGNDTSSATLQLWQGGCLVFELLVPKALHGPLVNDGYFASGVAWNADETAVAYVAEAPASEKTPAWGGPESLKDQVGSKSWRGQGPAIEDWGELNTGKRDPQVFILDLSKCEVTKVSTVPKDTSVGSPVWNRDGSGIVVVGWPHTPLNFPGLGRKLGVVFCYNRTASLHYVPISRNSEGRLEAGPSVQLTKSLGSATSPVFTPDGSHLVYISHDVAVTTGTHSATAQLHKLPWPQVRDGQAEPSVVVGPVQQPEAGAFPGLYAASLLDEPFIDDTTLVMTSQWRAQTAVLAINLESGQVKPLTTVSGPSQQSFSLQAVSGGRLFAIQVAPNLPPRVVTATLPGSGSLFTNGFGALEWSGVAGTQSELPAAVLEALHNLQYSVEEVMPTVGDVRSPFETVNFFPKDRQGPLPTIIAPHGGPHTAMTIGWYMPYAFLATLGYAVLCPNYRGSTGYGQAALASLPGNIGTNDVQDCVAALHAAIDSGLSDSNRVSIVGGSHGGFLTGHMLGQFPGKFRAGVFRNPVCNLSLMVGISDIVDWCFVEAFGPEEGRKIASSRPTPAQLQRLYQVSPMAHVDKVQVPVMFMLGAKDRRVPLADGLQYIGALRAYGNENVRVLTFSEDTHALDKPQTEYEQWINTAWWLKKYAT